MGWEAEARVAATKAEAREAAVMCECLIIMPVDGSSMHRLYHPGLKMYVPIALAVR